MASLADLQAQVPPPTDEGTLMGLLNRIGGAARTARQAISPWNVIAPTDVAGMLPGGGIPTAWEESGKGRDALKAGNYGQAAGHYGNMALNLVPEGGALAKLAMAAGPAIRAYHGSPHDFDQFSLSKIGTGEGAQVYGHGLYFAENEGVAKSYRDVLSADRTAPAQRLVSKHGGDVDAALAAANAEIERLKGLNLTPETGLDRAKSMISTQENNIAVLNQLKQDGKMSAGHMYEVNIKADPEHFLDWDKPLGEQHPVVRDAVNRVAREPAPYGLDRVTDDMRAIEMKPLIQSPEGIQALANHGVPGIKYLDQSSRAGGEGSRNMVVFDDKLVSILRKYGWAPGMAIPAAAAYEMQQAGAGQTPPHS